MRKTYEPPAAKTLSLGRLVSMSTSDKSRGRSRSASSPPVDKIVSHEPLAFFGFTELVLRCVRLVAQPMHVTSVTSLPVENWCTILLLSAPTSRTDPSLHAIARSCPRAGLAFLGSAEKGGLYARVRYRPLGFHRMLATCSLPAFCVAPYTRCPLRR